MNQSRHPATGRTRGHHGEDLACAWFRERGMVVLRRNLRKRWLGEIDLLVKHRGCLHLVEVKTGEAGWAELAQRVDEAKLRRLMATVTRCVEELPVLFEMPLQVDLFLIRINRGSPRYRWIQDILPPEFLLDPELPDDP